MPRPDTSRFATRTEGHATVIEIRPARPDTAFLAASVLLGGLFGLPALAVLLNPARHDALSLSAAGCAVLILLLAGWALRRALRGRRPVTLRLDPAGLAAGEQRWAWPALAARTVEAPPPVVAVGGVHGLAATIATRQRAAEARVMQHFTDGMPPVVLAGGLDAGVAERLLQALAVAETTARSGE
ncbi:hypothetical protein [Roseomonas haemaphysalidis]|uniref:DUF2244 domain-containing protein n=1 Tax=Roseomonas haemaphysalidis TaxID=2768162 RepID=A0ABS3KSW5_9PROT|nr:hypothetical protein [Roseomonas haemaphysalidis]MBO1080551.1 hypothetical protein [Roseomonas haemaphysalidis]